MNSAPRGRRITFQDGDGAPNRRRIPASWVPLFDNLDRAWLSIGPRSQLPNWRTFCVQAMQVASWVGSSEKFVRSQEWGRRRIDAAMSTDDSVNFQANLKSLAIEHPMFELVALAMQPNLIRIVWEAAGHPPPQNPGHALGLLFQRGCPLAWHLLSAKDGALQIPAPNPLDATGDEAGFNADYIIQGRRAAMRILRVANADGVDLDIIQHKLPE